MRNIIIAIDGYSSTGKSTVARQLAEWLNYIYVDSGAMYRAITLYAIRNGLISADHFDREGLIAALPDIKVDFTSNSQGRSEVRLNGTPVEKDIRSMQVSDLVSPVATIPEVRRKLVELQRSIGEGKGIVMDGRDIGTVVFPNADLKIFMEASPEVRARRRYDELLERGNEVSFDEVLFNVKERDHIDSTRKDSPLVKAEDAIVVDNTEINREDQFHIILQLAKDRIAGRV